MVDSEALTRRRGYLCCCYCGFYIRRKRGRRGRQRRCRCSVWHDDEDGQIAGRTQRQGLLWTHLEMPALHSDEYVEISGR